MFSLKKKKLVQNKLFICVPLCWDHEMVSTKEYRYNPVLHAMSMEYTYVFDKMVEQERYAACKLHRQRPNPSVDTLSTYLVPRSSQDVVRSEIRKM